MDSVTNNTALDALRWQQEDYTEVENDNGILTQEDFFSLLSAELANQDPTEPTDNNEIISQMTAFSTTDGVSTLNDQFSSFAATMSSSQALEASSLVGRSVLVDDNVFALSEGDDVMGKISTDENASNISIYVENTAGEIIQTVAVGDLSAGEANFTWNGLDGNGDPAPTGAYRFRIAGLVDGQATELQAMTYRKVESVTLAGAGGDIVLNLNGGTSMALQDVVEVSEG